MAYERVQKSFGQSSIKKKHTPIVPPLIEEQTSADSQLSPKVTPSRIPSSEEREAIKRKIFDSIRRSGENQAMGEGLSSPTVRVQKVPISSSIPGTPVQAKLTIGAPGDKYEQEADRVAAQVVSQINAPVAQQKSQNLPREEMSSLDEQNGGGNIPQNIQLTQQKQQIQYLDKSTSNHKETGIIQRLAATPNAKDASDQAVQNIDNSIGGSQLLSGWGQWTNGRAGHGFTVAERNAVNALGDQHGCCICGTKDPGTLPQPGRPTVNGKQVGNFIPDHEPPNSLVGGGYTGNIRFYPHCLTHSNMQAGVVARYKTEMKKIRSANDSDWATGVQGNWFWN